MAIDRTQYQILSQAQWNEYYNEASAEEYPLHHAIVHESRIEVIYQKIDKLLIDFLVKADKTLMKWTPLHIAVTLGRTHIVNKLLKVLESRNLLQVALETEDTQTFRPIHLAAPRPNISKLLIDYGADSNAKTRFNGTLHSYELMLTENIDLREVKGRISSVEHTFFRENGVTRPLSDLIKKGELQSKTGIQNFRDVPYVISQTWFKVWVYPFKCLEECRSFTKVQSNLTMLHELYEKTGHTAKLVIQSSQELTKSGSKLPQGIFSGEALKFKTIVGRYAGLVHDTVSRDDFHSTPTLTAKTVANCASRINWGFSNVYAYPQICDGLPMNVYLVSDPEGIKEGEELLSNYGNSCSEQAYFKPLAILGQERMLTFFAKGIDPLLEQLQLLGEGQTTDSIDCDMFYDKVFFPLAFPAALFKLHFCNLVPIGIWKSAKDSSTISGMQKTQKRLHVENAFKNIKKYYDQIAYGKLDAVIEQLYALEGVLSDKPALKKEIYSFFDELLGKYSVAQILYFMQGIYGKIRFEKEDLKDWESLAKDIQKKIGNYDPKKDNSNPCNPLSMSIMQLASQLDCSKFMELVDKNGLPTSVDELMNLIPGKKSSGPR